MPETQEWWFVKIDELEAELQAAQEREEALREALERYENEAPDWLKSIAREALAAQRTEEPSDDEGLDPIETSPLTEREPDL